MNRVSRRRWILGGVSAAILAAAGGLSLLRTRGYRLPQDAGRGLRWLEPWQAVVVAAFGKRILDPIDYDPVAFCDEYISRLPDPERADLTRFVGIIEHVAPLFAGRVRRFSSLDAPAQDAVLLALETHDLEAVRAGFQALKSLVLMAYYRLPSSFAAIGYDGPAVIWEEP